MASRSPAPRLLLLAALAVSAGLCGCGLLKTTAELPSRVAGAALGPGATPPPLDPNLVQARFMRFADIFALEIARATREFAERTGTPEGRIQALTWRTDYTNGLWRLAGGQQPYAAVFDGIVVITYLRKVHEERWLSRWGEANRPMIDSLVQLEEGVWSIADEGLTDEQLRQVREIVATWLAGDPASHVVDVAKLPGFGDLTGQSKAGPGSVVGEITSLISVDPLSGLEPAVREVQQTRLLAERAFYYLQRLPELLSARVELLALRSSQSAEVGGALASVERASQAAASLAATAEALPASFATEREAAFTQLSRELTVQREGLVHDLETARAPLTELLEGTRGTAEAGRAMADSLTETLQALDTFVGRFAGKDQEPSGSAPPSSAPSAADGEPAGRPFDITDYGATAERIGVAARELGTTIATLERSLPEVRRVLDEFAARADRSLDHAALRALQLLCAALAGTALASLLVRRISLRWKVAVERSTQLARSPEAD